MAISKWFEWSNTVYEKFDGFISRRLLKPTKGKNYVAIVEQESEKTFMVMHWAKSDKKHGQSRTLARRITFASLLRDNHSRECFRRKSKEEEKIKV